MVRAVQVALCICLSAAAVADADQDALQRRIDRAAELNVTAPWQESQALLDELKSELDAATPRQRAQITLLEARNKALAGDYDAAAELLGPLREDGAGADLRLSAYRMSANCAFLQGEYERGFGFLNEGLALLRQVEDPDSRVSILTVAAYFHSQAGEVDLSMRYANEALSIAESAADDRLRCVSKHELALAHARTGDIQTAIDARRDMLASCEEAGDPVFVGVAKNALSELLLIHGQTEQALTLAREALRTLEEAGYRDGILDARMWVANALIARGRHEEGKSLLVPLVDEFEGLDYWQDLRDIHQTLGELAESGNEYESALEHYKAAAAAGERFLNRERAIRLAYLQIEFDTRRKEQQIELLTERNRVQSQQRYLAVGGITALLIIGVLLSTLLVKTRSDRRRLLRLSQRDSLTGLYNHSSFFRRAGKALSACGKSGRPFTLLLADIDHFKAINDCHGHAAGDQALREVGECFRDVFGSDCIGGRVGGEEFAVALPEIDGQEARGLIDRFNRRMTSVAESSGILRVTRRMTRIAESSSAICVTMSYGLAEARDGVTLDLLHRQADDALYEAKRRGRDCTVLASELAG